MKITIEHGMDTKDYKCITVDNVRQTRQQALSRLQGFYGARIVETSAYEDETCYWLKNGAGLDIFVTIR